LPQGEDIPGREAHVRTTFFPICVLAAIACGGRESPVDPGPPASAPAADPGSGSGSGGGGNGATGGGGGSSSGATAGDASLVFAVVGDTRPAIPDDERGYPTDIITKIYTGIAAHSPQPSFVVGTGDYQFSEVTSPDAQLDLYLGARKGFAGPFYPAMGNHECTGATASNCGAGGKDGTTKQYSGFLSKMLAPIAQTSPYYTITTSAKDSSWTAKFVFVAANAWTSDQGTWLDAQLAAQTTYTFVVRHEPAGDTQAPGVAPSEAILAKHPYTLALVGHTHTFRRSGAREVIVGNGGAPLTGSVNYGWALVQRRADGAIQIDMIDYDTGKPTSGFALKADGSPA
jgi:hypothetical protein